MFRHSVKWPRSFSLAAKQPTSNRLISLRSSFNIATKQPTSNRLISLRSVFNITTKPNRVLSLSATIRPTSLSDINSKRAETLRRLQKMEEKQLISLAITNEQIHLCRLIQQDIKNSQINDSTDTQSKVNCIDKIIPHDSNCNVPITQQPEIKHNRSKDTIFETFVYVACGIYLVPIAFGCLFFIIAVIAM